MLARRAMILATAALALVAAAAPVCRPHSVCQPVVCIQEPFFIESGFWCLLGVAGFLEGNPQRNNGRVDAAPIDYG